jgi:hypothetical protein
MAARVRAPGFRVGARRTRQIVEHFRLRQVFGIQERVPRCLPIAVLAGVFAFLIVLTEPGINVGNFFRTRTPKWGARNYPNRLAQDPA